MNLRIAVLEYFIRFSVLSLIRSVVLVAYTVCIGMQMKRLSVSEMRQHVRHLRISGGPTAACSV